MVNKILFVIISACLLAISLLLTRINTLQKQNLNLTINLKQANQIIQTKEKLEKNLQKKLQKNNKQKEQENKIKNELKTIDTLSIKEQVELINKVFKKYSYA